MFHPKLRHFHRLTLSLLLISYTNLIPVRLLIVALLIGYYAMVRQSNFVMTGNTPQQCPHLLKFNDVHATPDALFVTIRSTKTRSSAAIPVTFRLPVVPSSTCCPVKAWSDYVRTCNPAPGSLALLLPTGLPLSAWTLL